MPNIMFSRSGATEPFGLCDDHVHGQREHYAKFWDTVLVVSIMTKPFTTDNCIPTKLPHVLHERMAALVMRISCMAFSMLGPTQVALRSRPAAVFLNEAGPVGDSIIDKQLSDPKLITYASISDEFKPLVLVALTKLDKFRALSGKPKYETIEGMVDAYVQEAADAGLGWTRKEAESEVVRYLQRRALADEGGLDGDGQVRAP